MIYNTLTKPERHLWISGTQADEEGKALLPVRGRRQTKRRFPAFRFMRRPRSRRRDMPKRSSGNIYRSIRADARLLIAELRAAQQGKAIAPLWWDVYKWFAVRPDGKAGCSCNASLRYTNEAEPLTPDTARLLYGTRCGRACRGMERFVAWPVPAFRHSTA
ncbi:hypothetical protein ACFSL6_00090 [Paenibacillus thailandensis]|uniref:hypothetical protein n=1 Tax=Paenibacillus thailandensis TaxID=393250 RepID=UPI00363FD6EE